MGKKAKKKDYEVGYCKTPKHSRFQKGNLGNRKGRRPKGSKNMKTIMNDLLDHDVAVTENGRTRSVKYPEALMHRMAASALKGSLREQIAMLKAIDAYAPEQLQEPAPKSLIELRFVKAKDGRPVVPEQASEPSSDAPGPEPAPSPGDASPDDHEDDDDSWLE